MTFPWRPGCGAASWRSGVAERQLLGDHRAERPIAQPLHERGVDAGELEFLFIAKRALISTAPRLPIASAVNALCDEGAVRLMKHQFIDDLARAANGLCRAMVVWIKTWGAGEVSGGPSLTRSGPVLEILIAVPRLAPW
jgi:hypothetical protein